MKLKDAPRRTKNFRRNEPNIFFLQEQLRQAKANKKMVDEAIAEGRATLVDGQLIIVPRERK